MAYLKIVLGSDAVGWFQPGLQNRLPNAVNRRGAVSPATLASARRMPVVIPGKAAGTTTVATDLHFVAPNASAPSRRAFGTARRNSSVLRTVIGIMSTPKAIPPASVEKCPMGTTTIAYAKIPMTIDGTPFRRSVV